MFKSLKTLGTTPTQAQLEGALLELYRLSFLLMVVPVSILGAIFARGSEVSAQQFTIYGSMCMAFMGLSFYLTERKTPHSPQSITEKPQARAFRKAVQLAVVPALPALFASICWAVPSYAAILFTSSAVVFVLGIWRLKLYSKDV
jgi:small neutral amino acid transporter SnatA (MarC family)